MLKMSSNYNTLCETFACTTCDARTFLDVKERFKVQINSKRRFEVINDFRDLISLLKKRDCLNEDNILPLEEIAAATNKSLLKNVVENYMKNLQDPNGNSAQTNCPTPSNRVPNGQTCGNLVLPQVPDTFMKRIHKTIAEDIGSQWQDFARGLHIKEGHIDQLMDTYRKIPDRVYEILRFKEESTASNVWRTVLCEALRVARRNDLRMQVEELFNAI